MKITALASLELKDPRHGKRGTWSPGQAMFPRCNCQLVQSSQEGMGAKTKEWGRGVWPGEKVTAAAAARVGS